MAQAPAGAAEITRRYPPSAVYEWSRQARLRFHFLISFGTSALARLGKRAMPFRRPCRGSSYLSSDTGGCTTGYIPSRLRRLVAAQQSCVFNRIGREILDKLPEEVVATVDVDPYQFLSLVGPKFSASVANASG